MAKKDYYKTLGVERTSSEDEIKKAYRKLAKEHHPDTGPNGGNKALFQEISEAWETLSDPDKKSKYDQFGHDAPRSRFTSEHFYQHQVRKGADLTLVIKLTLEEIFTGVKKTYKYTRADACPDCEGHGGTNRENCNVCGGSGVVGESIRTPFGNLQAMRPCHVCVGTGTAYTKACVTCQTSGIKNTEETINVDVPHGVQEGITFVMEGKGHFIKSGTHGDLHIRIMELPHEKFVRSGNDLKTVVKLTYPQLVLGDKVEIDTIEGGRIRIKIAGHSKVGSNLKIVDKGLKAMGKENRGELIITLDIDIPSKISKEEKELITKLKESMEKVATNETK